MPRENRLKLGLPAITPIMGGLPDMEGAGQGKTIYVAGSDHADLPSSLPWEKPSASACVRQVSLPLKRPSSHVGLPAITPLMGGLPDMEGAGQGRTIHVGSSDHTRPRSLLPLKKLSASACVRQVSLPLKRPSSRGRAMPSRVMSRDAENAPAGTCRSMPQPVRVKVFPAGMTNRYGMWAAAESWCKQHVVNSEQRCGFYPGVYGKRRSKRLPYLFCGCAGFINSKKAGIPNVKPC